MTETRVPTARRGSAPDARIPPSPPVLSRVEGPKRIWTVNGDFLGLGRSGVARYARELVRALDLHVAMRHPLTHDLDLRVVAPCRGSEPLALECLPLHVVEELPIRLPQVWLQLQLPRHVAGGLISLCNLAPIAIRRQIVCIHDLQTYTVPESYGRAFRTWHRVLLPLLGRRCDRIMTVSETSQRELAAFGVTEIGRITVSFNGADHAARWRPDQAWRAPGTERPFVLGLMRAEAHKNMELLWRLAEPLDALGLDLVLAGRTPTGALPCNAIALGPLSDDELASAFAQAFCFVLPSRTEGFGLPAVEAMSVGCPVVVSNVPSLKEVCQGAALYAAPDVVSDWVAAIGGLLRNPDLRLRLVQAGRVQAARFSWAAAAEVYLREMAAIDRRYTGMPLPA